MQVDCGNITKAKGRGEGLVQRASCAWEYLEEPESTSQRRSGVIRPFGLTFAFTTATSRAEPG